MDAVRFGRVLGIGTRLAGRTVVAAVDAAIASPPGAPPPAQSGAPSQQLVRAAQPSQAPRGSAPPLVARRPTRAEVRQGSRRFGEAVWTPFVRASGVLWLEVTGVFFGLIALLGLDGLWMNRAAIHWTATTEQVRTHFLIAAVVTLLFGYFTWSSFARAARRGRSSR